MDASIKANCSWTRTGGSEFSKVIQTSITNEDFFIKPELNEILSEDRAILLTRPEGTTEACEICIGVFPRYKFAALSVVCTAPKMELFMGAQYAETIYGTIITDEDDNDLADEKELMVQSFRYDVEIEKSGVVELTFKFIAQGNEVCIYGIILQIAPNPNGITTLTPPSINLDNVQELLKCSNQKLSPNAEKCKLFLETFSKTNLTKSCENPAAILEHMKLAMGKSHTHVSTESKTEESLDKLLKSHIDARLRDLEERINIRLNVFEQRQAEKLDQIIKLLGNK